MAFQSTLGYESRENLAGADVADQSHVSIHSRLREPRERQPHRIAAALESFNPLSATRAERTRQVDADACIHMFQSTLGYESRENGVCRTSKFACLVSIHSRLREPREQRSSAQLPTDSSFNPLSATRAERTRIDPTNCLTGEFQSTLGYESRENRIGCRPH